MHAALSALLLLLLYTLRCLRHSRKIQERYIQEAKLLSEQVLALCAENLSEGERAKLLEELLPSLTRYAAIIDASKPGQPEYFIGFATKRTLAFLRAKIPGSFSLDALEEAWQRYSDWRMEHYGRSLPTGTWRAFHELLLQAEHARQ